MKFSIGELTVHSDHRFDPRIERKTLIFSLKFFHRLFLRSIDKSCPVLDDLSIDQSSILVWLILPQSISYRSHNRSRNSSDLLEVSVLAEDEVLILV